MQDWKELRDNAPFSTLGMMVWEIILRGLSSLSHRSESPRTCPGVPEAWGGPIRSGNGAPGGREGLNALTAAMELESAGAHDTGG